MQPESRMTSLSDAFPTPSVDAYLYERAENPQAYDEPLASVRHVKERRHVLGLVGGKEVGTCAGNMADLESDLFGITRPNTNCAARKHLPPTSSQIERKNAKMNLTIDATPVPLQDYQQWAYPAVLAPVPLVKETCHRPEKY
jgi:hypothetical protein